MRTRSDQRELRGELAIKSCGGRALLVAYDHRRVRNCGYSVVPCAEGTAVAAAVVGAAVGVVPKVVHRYTTAPQRSGTVDKRGEP